jgi:hypothetical protein
MRILFLAACAVYLSATGAASAADCTKGMLWPYVRGPGDCLTPDEIKSGKLGAYSGPVNTDPDVATIPRSAPAESGAVAPSAPASASPAPVVSAAPASPSAGTPAPPQSTAQSNAVTCHKGLLWPFVRSDGDCPTDTERKEGKTVYGNPAAVTPASAPPGAVVSAAPASPQSTAQSNAASCHKGLLWPFVRSDGDCPTDTERKEGKTVYGNPAALSPASATASTPTAPKVTPVSATGNATAVPATEQTPQPDAAAPTCHKGIFWPFVRQPGDCPTDAEKQSATKKPGSGR